MCVLQSVVAQLDGRSTGWLTVEAIASFLVSTCPLALFVLPVPVVGHRPSHRIPVLTLDLLFVLLVVVAMIED